jgi:hypothetical protein
MQKPAGKDNQEQNSTEQNNAQTLGEAFSQLQSLRRTGQQLLDRLLNHFDFISRL